TSLSPTYAFPTFGEYDVWVEVTGTDGQTGDGWFHVTAREIPPAASVSVGGPISEGQAATFTVRNLDPDSLDTVTIYANWTGSPADAFDQLTDGDYTVNPDGSVTFSHVYLDTPASGSY